MKDTRSSASAASRRAFAALAALAFAAPDVPIGCAPPDEPDDRPDVVLIMIDTLRPDHLGFCGFEQGEPAPFLAERSTVFPLGYAGD